MKLIAFIGLWISVAVAQCQIPSYEPHKLTSYLKHLKAELEGCEPAEKTREAFERDELVTKELQTSLPFHGCSEFGETAVRLDGVHQAAFVRMQCGWDLDLVFTQEVDAGWRFLQTIVIPNKYWEVKVSVASVTGDDSQQVLVHNAQYRSGTGIGQQNFVVYKLIDRRVVPVLDVVESAHLMLPWTQHEVSQDSKFVFEPATRGELPRLGSPPIFEETQVLDFPGGLVELKRDHMWRSDRRLFLATQWFSARRLGPRKKKATK